MATSDFDISCTGTGTGFFDTASMCFLYQYWSCLKCRLACWISQWWFIEIVHGSCLSFTGEDGPGPHCAIISIVGGGNIVPPWVKTVDG